MITARLSSHTDFRDWRDLARRLCAAHIPPEAIAWSVDGEDAGLFGHDFSRRGPVNDRPVHATPHFIESATRVICHRDPERFARLYRILCRLQENRHLLSNSVDPDTLWLRDRDKAIRRDEHKMHAFVRFRLVDEQAGRERYAAWFEPKNRIVELTAGFFVRRFTGMDWAILTPERSAFWINEELSFGDGASRSDVPAEDAVEDQWRTYYSAIFNPARLKLKSMRQHMAKYYWRNLPEAKLIPSLTAGAASRVAEMRESAVTSRNALADKLHHAKTAHEERPSLSNMKAAVDACTRCPLHRDATQGVAGEGPAHAPIMLVGEQPGDQEDLQGKPFVGPAGQLLDRALEEAGIARDKVFVTNAVKHFKFTPRGKRRIHSKPSAGEIDVCRWWLAQEIALVKPKLIIGLGASAARSLIGHTGTLTNLRGQDHQTEEGVAVRITVHPSYLLRIPEASAKSREYRRFVEDLAGAAQLAA